MRPGSAPAALAVLGEPGWRLLLAAAAAFDAHPTDPLRAASTLGKRCAKDPPERRAAALELVTSGAALAAKLGIDERLIAVREAVEQASSGRVATWHAQQLPTDARLIEIGCGCGGDSLALAHRVKNLVATDVDPVRAACTHMNLMAMELANARAEPGDGVELLASSLGKADAVFADPDRRVGGERSLDPVAWSPSLPTLLDLAEERPVYAKLAPSLDAEWVTERMRVSYVSYRRACVEAFVEPPSADGARVRAVLLPDDGPALALEGNRSDAPVAKLGASLYVPDAAAIRARLLAELCERHGLGLVDDGVAWLTGGPGVSSPWLQEFAVVDVLPLRPDAVGRAIADHAPRVLRVHARAVATRADDLERGWARQAGGDGPDLDVFATLAAGARVAILALKVPIADEEAAS